MMGILNFLGHAGFYRYFIKDFWKIVNSLCEVLKKEVMFDFDKACLKSLSV